MEVHVPDRVDDQWVQPAAENAIEEEFGKALTLWSVNEDEALQYFTAESRRHSRFVRLTEWRSTVLASIADSLIFARP